MEVLLLGSRARHMHSMLCTQNVLATPPPAYAANVQTCRSQRHAFGATTHIAPEKTSVPEETTSCTTPPSYRTSRPVKERILRVLEVNIRCAMFPASSQGCLLLSVLVTLTAVMALIAMKATTVVRHNRREFLQSTTPISSRSQQLLVLVISSLCVKPYSSRA